MSVIEDALAQVHGQDARRTYSVAEVKQIVYPLIEALRTAERHPTVVEHPDFVMPFTDAEWDEVTGSSSTEPSSSKE
jgi:hypothetical protein